jgi:hypothetical protein
LALVFCFSRDTALASRLVGAGLDLKNEICR